MVRLARGGGGGDDVDEWWWFSNGPLLVVKNTQIDASLGGGVHYNPKPNNLALQVGGGLVSEVVLAAVWVRLAQYRRLLGLTSVDSCKQRGRGGYRRDGWCGSGGGDRWAADVAAGEGVATAMEVHGGEGVWGSDRSGDGDKCGFVTGYAGLAKGVVRFRITGKLTPDMVGPFKVLERLGPLLYKLDASNELQWSPHAFQVSNLKKCYSDEPLVVPLEGLHMDDKLRFVEEPVDIIDREVKRLKQSRIPIVKVRWNSRRSLEFTWEREDQFQKSLHPLKEPCPQGPLLEFYRTLTIGIRLCFNRLTSRSMISTGWIHEMYCELRSTLEEALTCKQRIQPFPALLKVGVRNSFVGNERLASLFVLDDPSQLSLGLFWTGELNLSDIRPNKQCETALSTRKVPQRCSLDASVIMVLQGKTQ
ncbi:hypothetical protein Tco_1321343 [Tanacetum coccineum]